MINNFSQIEMSLLNFKQNRYYKFEAIIRSKDGENNLATNPNSTTLHSWVIDSKESFDRLKPIMIEFCHRTNARLYMTLDRKSTLKTYANTLKELTASIVEIMHGGEYKISRLQKLFNSQTSKKENTDKGNEHEICRTWMIDIDTKLEWVWDFVSQFCIDNQTYICTLKTPNGFHIVARKCFGADMFKDCLETDMLYRAENHPIFKYQSQKQKADTIKDVINNMIELKENALGLVYKED